MMHSLLESHLHLTRRQFFGDNGIRLGGLALAMIAGGAFCPNKTHAARNAAFCNEGQVAGSSVMALLKQLSKEKAGISIEQLRKDLAV